MNKEPSIKDIASQLGKLGGRATSNKYGSEYYRELQKLSAKKRRANKSEADKEKEI